MPPFRSEMRNQAVKDFCYSCWLDETAREHKVNYSHLLQEALKNHLGIHQDPHS